VGKVDDAIEDTLDIIELAAKLNRPIGGENGSLEYPST
jgi:hypothetical protein